MTVCIAAIFENSGIVAASDRMLTAGDIQFEPAVPKLRFLTNSIAALIAGDANLQSEVISAVLAATRDYLQGLDTWAEVSVIAGIYKRECDRILSQRAERRILAPFGLSLSEFLSRQREFSDEFVKNMGTELLNFEAPPLQAIVTGCDGTGPHIYTVDNNSFQCHDAVGFAAIGVGEDHANSQMMSFNHTFRHSLADTLRAVFYAKKRAEIAPGVGPATDMMVVVGTGGLSMIAINVQQELEKRYAEEKRQQERVANRTREKIGHFVQAILEQPVLDQPPVGQSQFPITPSNPSSPALENKKTLSPVPPSA